MNTNLATRSLGGRLVKWKGRVASLAPALASVSVIALTTTGAFGQTVFDSLENSEQIITIDEDITVTADGTVRLRGGSDTAPLYIDVADYSRVVTNDGLIDVLQNAGTSAAGIWLEGNLTGGSIINAGDITLDLTNENTEPSASGIYVSGDVDGTITNASTGLVDVLVASEDYDVTAYGIQIDGNVGQTGVISNAGLITVEADSTDETVLAFGIDVGGDLDGAISNSATIDVRAEAGSETATGYGIYVSGDVGSTGSIENSGDLLVEALSGTESSVYAYGIYVGGNLSGAITNTGTGLIDVVALGGTSHATAYGIFVGGSVDVGASIANDGMIAVEADNPGSSSASAYGIYVDSDMNGTIDNAGTLDVYAESGSSDAEAYGIYVSGDVGSSGSIKNSGDLLVEALAGTESSVSAYGIYVGGDLSGAITNTGTGLIDVVAHGGTSDASAYGIYFGGSVAVGASITNDGMITAEAYVAESSNANAYGIYVGSDMDGTIDNTGTIDVYAESGSSSASAYGIYVGGTVGGAITNAGNIIVEGYLGTDSNIYAFGIHADGTVDGSITNSGLIDVFAQSMTSSAEAYGIYVDGDVNGTLTNTQSGVITASALAPGDAPIAYGVYVDGNVNVDGGLVNDGTIEAFAEGLDGNYAYAQGIVVAGDLDGTIVNTGEVLVSALATSYTAYAYGIEIKGDLNGRITNTGAITATADTTEYSSATAWGVYIEGAFNGTIDGNGTISATAMSDYYNADAYGISAEAGIGAEGLIDVSGLIEATALASSSASAHGIYVFGDMDGMITVSGTIDVMAQSTSDSSVYVGGIRISNDLSGEIENRGVITVEGNSASYAEGWGMYVQGTVDGSITNAGTIETSVVTSSSTGTTAQAYGIWADEVGVEGTVTNTGYIDVYAGNSGTDAGTSDYAAGVYLRDMNGHFINTGSIVARQNGDPGTAIYVQGQDGQVTLNTRGFIVGGIVLNGSGDLTIQGDVGRSVNWTAELSVDSGNLITDLGTTVFLSEPGQQIDLQISRGNGEGQVATLDTSGLAAVRQAGADAGFVGLDALRSQTGHAAAKPVAEGDGGGNTLMPFVAVASKSATYGDSETMLDQDVTTSAISFGGTMTMDSGLTFGLGAGTMNGSTTVDYIGGPASETDQTGAFVGLAMGGTSGNLNFSGAISAGGMQFDNTRYVNDNTALDGIVTEGAAFDSSFMAVEFAVSGRFDLGSGMALVPNTTLRYAKHTVDGYAEVGSDGAAVVGPQDFGVFEGEIGVALEKALGNGVFSGGISLMSRSITGGEDVQVTMIGDTNFVDAAIGSSSATKLSVGYSSSFSTSGEFNVNVETMVGSNGMSGGKISGEVRFSF